MPNIGDTGKILVIIRKLNVFGNISHRMVNIDSHITTKNW